MDALRTLLPRNNYKFVSSIKYIVCFTLILKKERQNAFPKNSNGSVAQGFWMHHDVREWRPYRTTIMAAQDNYKCLMRIWAFQSPNITFKLCMRATEARSCHCPCTCKVRMMNINTYVHIRVENTWFLYDPVFLQRYFTVCSVVVSFSVGYFRRKNTNQLACTQSAAWSSHRPSLPMEQTEYDLCW